MKENFKRKVLKNGFTILFEKRDVPVVSVAFGVRQGGLNESFEEKGISHFIEHLLYKGTPKRNWLQIAEEIEKRGGHMNGATSDILTMYYCKMPSKHINVALDVLSDMIKNPLFQKEELDKERMVILEEMKMHRDNPRRHALEEIQGLMFKGPFGIPLIGTTKTLADLDREKLLEKFKEAYRPSNLILCVVGDCDFKDIVKFAEDNFPESEKAKVLKPKVVKTNGSKVEKRKGVDQANIVFAYSVPLASDDKSYAAEVLSSLLSEGASSRLFLEIREKRNLAYAILGDSNIAKDFAFNFIYVGANKENVDEVKKLILEEFKKVAEGLTQGELDQVKEQIIGHYKISMEDSETQMVQLLYQEVNGNAEEYYDYEKNISKVKLEDVKNLAKIKDYSFFALVPEN